MLEDVVCANIHELFLGGAVEGAHLFRVVRDADLEIDHDDAQDLLQTVEGSLKQLRQGPISLLQLEADMPARMRQVLVEALGHFERRGRPDARAARPRRLGAARRGCIAPSSRTRPFAPRSLWRRDEDPTVIFDSHPRRGPAGPPSLRVVRLGRDVRPRRGRSIRTSSRSR